MKENRNEGHQGHRDSERYPGSDRGRSDPEDSSERVTNRESGGDRGTGRGSREGSEGTEDTSYFFFRSRIADPTRSAV